jgi:hypothetical protein
MTYKDADVDIDAGAELVLRIAKMAPGIGGFGVFFPLGKTPPPPPFLFACLAGNHVSCLRLFLLRMVWRYKQLNRNVPRRLLLTMVMERAIFF